MNMEQQAEAVGTGPGEGWFTDPKTANLLMIATYVVGGVGIGLGIYALLDGGGPKALHWAMPLMVGAVGILAGIRHSVFHVADARRAGVDSNPFYMIELGFANAAIGIVALVAFFSRWGIAAEASITLIYALYLGMAFFIFLTKVMRAGVDGGKIFAMLMWVAQVFFMFYFAIAAGLARRPSLF
jgi:hypothetical protein